MVHAGVKKQALAMQCRFQIDDIGLYDAIKKVKKGFSLCQACIPDNRNVERKPNGRQFLTSPWRVWPWTSSAFSKCTSERKFCIL